MRPDILFLLPNYIKKNSNVQSNFLINRETPLLHREVREIFKKCYFRFKAKKNKTIRKCHH